VPGEGHNPLRNPLEDSMTGNAFLNNLYLWILVPGLCFVFVALSFSLIGSALDGIFTPKLRRRYVDPSQ
jgi:peptide/nickel transport system permease protein